eukprot:scaffold3421_cov181-Amphora_coffeaeformis.AAC.1
MGTQRSKLVQRTGKVTVTRVMHRFSFFRGCAALFVFAGTTTAFSVSPDLSSRQQCRWGPSTTALKDTTRREFGAVALVTLLLPVPAFAEAFTRQTADFGYEFQPPENFGAGNKPLKTHLDEINFK